MKVINQKVVSITGVVKSGVFYQPWAYLVSKRYGLIQVNEIFCYIDEDILKEFSEGDLVHIVDPKLYINFESVG